MTDAADDTFAGLTDYEPVYEMDVAGGALVLGFSTSQDDELLCPRAFAPGLRSTRLPLESEPLLRSVCPHEGSTSLLICASASRARSQR